MLAKVSLFTWKNPELSTHGDDQSQEPQLSHCHLIQPIR